jgi:hypothetical protein
MQGSNGDGQQKRTKLVDMTDEIAIYRHVAQSDRTEYQYWGPTSSRRGRKEAEQH